MITQAYIDTAHLLRRAGFGASPATIQAAVQAGLPATTDALLHPERTPNHLDDDEIINRLATLVPERKNGMMPAQVVKWWWTNRMIRTQNPLVEKMTLFWHGHFTSNLAGDGDRMLAQNRMFRKNALGSFRTLTLAVSRDPAMLRYLNGNQNYKAHPNENYGRELMELFTCGIGNYTEDDVKAAARAFSGWNLRQDEFVFNPRQHDNDPKTFLGKTGNWNGDDIVDMLVAHPATARRVCTQLFTYFAYPNPEPAVVDSLVATYYSSGYDIRTILGQIFRSKAFYSEKARSAIIKCPVQYVIGSVKMLELEPVFSVQASDISLAGDLAGMPGQAAPATPAQNLQGQKAGKLAGLTSAMRSMGQDILAPPSVKGWDGGEAWINTTTLLNRVNFANRISQSRTMYNFLLPQVTAYAGPDELPDPAAWVDYLAQALGPLELSATTRQMLIDFANSTESDNGASSPFTSPDQIQLPASTGKRGRAGQRGNNPPQVGGMEGRMLGLIPLIMATPEYQVC